MHQRDPETYAILGAAMEVHRVLGAGFLEPVYHDALAVELGARRVPFVHEALLSIHYKGQLLRSAYRPDFVCFGSILVELKALKTLTSTEESQVINYLRASGLQRALLINFGGRSLQYRRFVGWGRSTDDTDYTDGPSV